ncbi:MAG: 2Fe-2S iron-sulfur cluster binding domain-containing protein [Acetobacteraceae bacterium]|nr:2Fe-2S iron-sulfur cluster binding domain-containing protein [Acetobacteraceae bacterium]
MSFRIHIPETGESFAAEPGESVLQAARRAEVFLPHDCEAGDCGTCRIRLLEGHVAYDEFPLALMPEEAAEGYALACQARPESDLVIEPAQAPLLLPDPERHSARVLRVEPLCEDVTHLVLEVPEAESLAWVPGQYMNIHLEDGRSRSFSMASRPSGGRLDFHVRRIPGGDFTERRLARLRPGDMLEVELPLGSFVYREADFRPLLMLATGTGIAPIKSMLEALAEDPGCPPVTLYWGMRRRSDLYAHEQLRALGERLSDFRYIPVLSRADAAWAGRRGYVQQAALEDLGDLSEHAIYLCGSPAMIADAKQALIARGASMRHIYTEAFTARAAAPVAA